MCTFRKIFPKKHVFLAVIHVESIEQAERNIKIAAAGGADGVFLINHSIHHMALLVCHEVLRRAVPNFWTGLNCLDIGMSAVDFIPKDTNGLWVDNAAIIEDLERQLGAEKFAEIRQTSGWQGLYFGGVAFKGQRAVTDYARVAKLAMPYVDVITTSGKGTGIAADVSKIRQMKQAIGSHPLAIASGITPENVQEYMPYADCFLVATGVSDSHTELNPERVRQLAQALNK
jgi:uncharacterized protein